MVSGAWLEIVRWCLGVRSALTAHILVCDAWLKKLFFVVSAEMTLTTAEMLILYKWYRKRQTVAVLNTKLRTCFPEVEVAFSLLARKNSRL